jgi:Mob1/phocein family
MQNQIGTQDTAKQSRLYLYRPFVNAALVNGNFKTIVMLPKFVSVNEWVAINGRLSLIFSLFISTDRNHCQSTTSSPMSTASMAFFQSFAHPKRALA